MDRSHVTELTQKTRLDLENERLSLDQLNECIQVRTVGIERTVDCPIVFEPNVFFSFLPGIPILSRSIGENERWP